MKSIEIDDRDNNPGTIGTDGQVNANFTSTADGALPHSFHACGSNSDDQDCPQALVAANNAYGD